MVPTPLYFFVAPFFILLYFVYWQGYVLQILYLFVSFFIGRLVVKKYRKKVTFLLSTIIGILTGLYVFSTFNSIGIGMGIFMFLEIGFFGVLFVYVEMMIVERIFK